MSLKFLSKFFAIPNFAPTKSNSRKKQKMTASPAATIRSVKLPPAKPTDWPTAPTIPTPATLNTPRLTPLRARIWSTGTPGYYLVNKDDVNQSTIHLIGLGTTRDNPDFYAISVFNEMFGGGFSSR